MAKKSDVVRVGFIGVGGVARWAHLGHLSKWEDVKLVAFADVNKEGVEKTAGEFKAKPYTDAKKMLDSEELDAVYVCLPPFAHTNQELLVCERKLGLFVEKPLATTLEKGREISDAVKKAKNVSAVGYNWRSCDITKKAKELIGKKRISAAYGYWVGGMPGVMWWRQQAQSGGQLNEQATHVVDIARHIIGGKVVSVYAQGSKGIYSGKVEKHDVHDNAIALLTFDNGCVCSIGTGHASHQGFRVGIDFLLEDLTISHNNGELKLKHPKGEETIRTLNKPYEEEDRAFLEAVKKNEPEGVYCTYADAFETHRVCMAANDSMESGKPVALK
jgi:myo-inositol 2-dehydrogenase / D-chiro-inositol 1-dehydrogenase